MDNKGWLAFSKKQRQYRFWCIGLNAVEDTNEAIQQDSLLLNSDYSSLAPVGATYDVMTM